MDSSVRQTVKLLGKESVEGNELIKALNSLRVQLDEVLGGRTFPDVFDLKSK
jgi:hypothetical protein